LKKNEIKQKPKPDHSSEQIDNPIHRAVQTETSLPHKRRYRAILFVSGLAILIIAFAILTVLVKRTAFFPIDLKITRFIQSMDYPVVTSIMNIVSWVGYAPQSFIFPGIIIILLFALGLHWESLVCLVTAVSEELFNLLIKIIIHRPRPSVSLVRVYETLGSYSFPSGHVMFYTCFFGFIGFMVFTLLKPSWKRTLLLIVAGSQVLLIGVSRVYLGEHWASDAVGAYLLGSIILAAIIQFYRWGKPRFFTRQPVARGRR
jgi:membrane-associated phospholipid phosphatase